MFLEEVLPVCPGYNSDVAEGYSVDIHETANGYEYVSQRHPYVRLTVSLRFNNRPQSDLQNALRDLFHRAGGSVDGFRFQNYLDYSTNNYTGTPTYNDQACTNVSAGVYQIMRWYGNYGQAGASRRRIRKPRSDSVLVGIRNDDSNGTEPAQVMQGFTVDYTTGLIAFDSNVTQSITSISQAPQAVVGFGSSPNFSVNDSVHFSGVSGMTEINGMRGTVQSVGANDITVDIDSSAFTAYSSGGDVNTRPQDDEEVTAGCLFDIPVRFRQPEDVLQYINRNSDGYLLSNSIDLIEIINL